MTSCPPCSNRLHRHKHTVVHHHYHSISPSARFDIDPLPSSQQIQTRHLKYVWHALLGRRCLPWPQPSVLQSRDALHLSSSSWTSSSHQPLRKNGEPLPAGLVFLLSVTATLSLISSRLAFFFCKNGPKKNAKERHSKFGLFATLSVVFGSFFSSRQANGPFVFPFNTSKDTDCSPTENLSLTLKTHSLSKYFHSDFKDWR